MNIKNEEINLYYRIYTHNYFFPMENFKVSQIKNSNQWKTREQKVKDGKYKVSNMFVQDQYWNLR